MSQKLVAAVLAKAIVDVHSPVTRVSKDARDWINRKRDEPFSLDWCCDAIDMDAEKVRESINY